MLCEANVPPPPIKIRDTFLRLFPKVILFPVSPTICVAFENIGKTRGHEFQKISRLGIKKATAGYCWRDALRHTVVDLYSG